MSKLQKDIKNCLSDIINNKISENVEIANYYVNLYIPDLRLAIDCTYCSIENRQQNKYLALLKEGIRLITIFKYEWDVPATRSKIKNLLRTACGLPASTAVHAENTDIRLVDVKDVKKFVKANSLINLTGYDTALGLYVGPSLLQLMLFKDKNIIDANAEILCNCIKQDYEIIDGTAKLFNHYVKNYTFDSLIAYCSLNKFTGTTYKELGMTFKEYTVPDYFYVDRHNNLVSKYDYDIENKFLIRHFKVFDCGYAYFTYER